MDANPSGSSNKKDNKHHKPKVIIVPRKNTNENNSHNTNEAALAALKVPPAERTRQDIETIIDTVGKWPKFRSNIHTQQEIREVCRRIQLEECKGNTILFKQGDEPDGWYLLFSGSCSIYGFTDNSAQQANINPTVLQILRNATSQTQCFCHYITNGPKSDFGSVALINNKPRNATVFIDEPSILLRVDPQIYRDTAAWFARNQIENRASILSHIEEIQIIKDNHDVFSRLAENMAEKKLEAGTIIDVSSSLTDGFIVVEEGLLAKERVVDFAGCHIDEEADGPLAVKIPNGKHSVRIKTLGSKTMFPDPTLTDFVPYPFNIVVLEPAIVHCLKLSDLKALVPMTQLQKIKDIIRNEPSDKEVIELWISRQKAVQWQAFKRRCVKEVRQSLKIEREMNMGTWCMRRPGMAKSIKDHKQFPPLIRTSRST